MIKCFISGFFLVSLVFSLDVNFSLETKYGDGNKVTSQDGTPVYSDYKFIENILDINSTFDNGIFISTQLEYSDPPVLGASVKGLNNFVIDYMGDNYSVKLGNLYSLYGRGLSLNMTQNQNIDYDHANNCQHNPLADSQSRPFFFELHNNKVEQCVTENQVRENLNKKPENRATQGALTEVKKKQ